MSRATRTRTATPVISARPSAVGPARPCCPRCASATLVMPRSHRHTTGRAHRRNSVGKGTRAARRRGMASGERGQQPVWHVGVGWCDGSGGDREAPSGDAALVSRAIGRRDRLVRRRRYLALAQQDRSRWDRELLGIGLEALDRAMRPRARTVLGLSESARPTEIATPTRRSIACHLLQRRNREQRTRPRRHSPAAERSRAAGASAPGVCRD